MSPEKQRIAIAEFCGWTFGLISPGETYNCWRDATGTVRYAADLPDYVNDLNALHYAEKELTPGQRIVYRSLLAEISNVFDADPDDKSRCLLMVIGKWKETP